MKWQTLTNYFYIKILETALNRDSPNNIPLTGDERLKERNYFSTRLFSKNDNSRFLLKGYSSECVTGIFWEDDQPHGLEASLPNNQIPNYYLKITQYYGAAEVRYTSYLGYVLGRYSFLATRVLLKKRFLQWCFNQKKLVKKERYELLDEIYEEAVLNRNFSTSNFSLMIKAYGDLWVKHPGHEEVLNHYKLLLDSLVSSNDLNKFDNTYSLNAHALATLAENEDSNRKHSDAIKIQYTLAFLSFGLIVVGIFQIIFS